jgi:hypothetical protein
MGGLMGFWRRNRDKQSTPKHTALTLEELSSGLREALMTIHGPVETCRQAQGYGLVQGWRELHIAVRVSADRLNGLLGDAPSPRLERMVELTSGEVWEVAERWLSQHDPTTPEDMALLWTVMWDRAEAARAACAGAQGDEVTSVRERLLRLVDQADAGVARLDDGVASDEQLQAWRQSAEELRRFVDQVLGRRP